MEKTICSRQMFPNRGGLFPGTQSQRRDPGGDFRAGGLDVQGNLVGKGDFRAQTRQVFENLKNMLASSGRLSRMWSSWEYS